MTSADKPPFSNYQNEIYLSGLAGAVPPFTTDTTSLEDLARDRLESGPFWYVAGGAGSGATMRANRDAFESRRIVPRMLTGATVREMATTVLGTEMPAPVLLAPVGVQSIVHPDGELATARAAAEVGLPLVLSTASSHTLEDVTAASGNGSRWFQLYWPNENDVTLSILDRARKSGFRTLVVTLDTWTLAWRPNDLDRSYLPFLRGVGTAIPFSDPAFRAGLEHPPEEDLTSAVLRWVSMFTGTDKQWPDLSFLRENWHGPIVLKGVLCPEDARRARDAGMDGVIVSNHGGRQVDGSVAALDALSGVAGAVGSDLDVLFDSGVRTGTDIIKAVASGAKAVLLGRPYVYGLALGGEQGVQHVLRSVLADLDLSLGLSGNPRVSGIGPDCLHT